MTNLITLRKSTFDWAYSIARSTIERDPCDSPHLARTIWLVQHALSQHFGFKGIWRLLTPVQQNEIVIAVAKSLYDAALCDPLESMHVDRRIRASEFRDAKMLGLTVRNRPVRASDFLYLLAA